MINREINYHSLNVNLLKLIKNPYFNRHYKSGPKNIIDIEIMVQRVITYLDKMKLN